ncbi:hypothetical protein ACIOHC_36230 [Streptomyces sp. NPDC088252]|uniref:hypothetical protein n=1 Tax=Streptomyces sp. NPDC088252 TaxID=3365845 RepID=UPI0037FFC02B
MGYINVGAYIDGERPKTKKALTDALANNPGSVRFDRTSPLDGSDGKAIAGDAIPETDTLTVTGPDPYTSRKWYASVKRTPTGPKVIR